MKVDRPSGNCASSDMQRRTPLNSTTTPDLPICTGGRSTVRSVVALNFPAESISRLTPSRMTVSFFGVPSASTSGSHLSPFFTTGVSPQPLSVRIYSAIRFGVQPSINAVGTLMLLLALSFPFNWKIALRERIVWSVDGSRFLLVGQGKAATHQGFFGRRELGGSAATHNRCQDEG